LQIICNMFTPTGQACTSITLAQAQKPQTETQAPTCRQTDRQTDRQSDRQTGNCTVNTLKAQDTHSHSWPLNLARIMPGNAKIYQVRMRMRLRIKPRLARSPRLEMETGTGTETALCLWKVTWSWHRLCVDCFIMKMLIELPAYCLNNDCCCCCCWCCCCCCCWSYVIKAIKCVNLKLMISLSTGKVFASLIMTFQLHLQILLLGNVKRDCWEIDKLSHISIYKWCFLYGQIEL